ncbi:MAG: hypothetical protein ACOYNN_12070 [Terrimicrobiaceae bacterium]
MKKLFAVSFAAALIANSALAQNATTTPVGVMTISLPPSKSMLISIPMVGDAVYSGVISSLTANSITVAGSPWSDIQFGGATPHFVQLKSGLHAGRFLRIVSNTPSSITVDTDDIGGLDVPLTVSGKAAVGGDRFQITVGDTIGSLFGSTVSEIAPLVGATRLSSADNISVLNPVSGKTDIFYFNTSPGVNRWTRSGSTVSQNNFVLTPGQGIGISTVAAGGVTRVLTITGNVPDVAPVFKFEPRRSDRFGTTFPVDITLAQLDFGANWVKHNRSSSADLISIFNPNTLRFTTYYKKPDNNWYINGNAASQNSVVIPAGSSIGVSTTSTLSGAQLLYPLPLPYNL